MVLGLLRDQSLKIEAHEKALQDNEAVRVSMQNAIDKLVRERGELASSLNELKVEHSQLLTSEKTASVVDELRQEIEVRMSEVILHSTSSAEEHTNQRPINPYQHYFTTS